ncbi:hypothetical protein [Spirosoma sp.]|uniref:hypothetical protein n=1 Tax=Spirosoma sp. TaxID=1899569 RepID=UPI00262E860E|nr:hypothetical protein [Spirosoma sp.]MCX6216601.1 hypothetical protein [Spirosoma sp.]
MKAKQIRFFSPDENSEAKKKDEKPVVKTSPVTGYISSTGKLVFPSKSIAQLGLDPTNNQFKVGTQDGKRKIKSLYLIPSGEGEEQTFELVQGAKSYAISLPFILQKGGIDFAETKYNFLVKPFDYEDGVTGYELKLTNENPKPEYTGKPRGRKKLSTSAE